jgi:hypothetical protein
MKTMTRLFLFAGLVLFGGLAAFSAPIRPVGPVDITGTISEVRWVPERTVKGVPRMSGSAGKDRVVSPHFLVRLVDFEGVSSEAVVTMTRYLDSSAYPDQDFKDRPPFVLLKIDSIDQNYLKKGLRIKVRGYKVAGDEGGTWTSFTGIEILPRAPRTIR